MGDDERHAEHAVLLAHHLDTSVAETPRFSDLALDGPPGHVDAAVPSFRAAPNLRRLNRATNADEDSRTRCGNGGSCGGLSSVSTAGPRETLTSAGDFAAWYGEVEPRLRLALVAAYGPERGREATAEALAWAWEHQDRIERLANPVAYLYRVGQSRTRLRRFPILHGRAEYTEPRVEPRLGRALARLSERQRVVVVLVHGYGWAFAEVGELLGIKVTTVQNHLNRGLDHLRAALEVSSDG